MCASVRRRAGRSARRHALAILALLGPWSGIATLTAAPIAAQQHRTAAPSGTFVRDVRERWLNARQRPAFTPMTESSRWVKITGVAGDAAAKTRTLSLSFSADAGAGTARLTTDDRGRVVRLVASFPSPRPDRGALPALVSPAEELRWAIFDGVEQRYASLPETRVWDLVPVRDSQPLAFGRHWRDTLDLRASLGEYRQSLRGVRESTVIGDTLVHGRRLWIVRDSAVVHYEEHLLVEERTLDTLAVVDRSGDGTIVGRHLLDPELGVDRLRNDTTSLTGLAVLRYPDGRSFSTPARYERTQRVELLDAAAFAARERKRRAEQGEFSIVFRFEGNEERVANGDSALINALLDTLATARDPDARARAAQMLRLAGSPAIRPRLSAAWLRAGDTVSVIHELENAWLDPARSIDERDLALLLPVMADPGVAFAFGLDRDPHLENARQGLLTHPPAVTPSTAEWPCAPAACRMLAAEWNADVDPRLKSLGLIAQFTLDPKRWADTVMARYQAGDRFLEPAVSLIRGVAASWPAGSHAGLPPVGADWRAWSNWMDGRDPAYRAMGSPELARFEDPHTDAIRLAQAMTGRVFAAEWRDAMRTATNDSARYVYGSLLLGIDALSEDASTIAARLQSTSPLMRDLARREVSALLDRGTPLADSATTVEVQNRVLAVAIDGAAPWPLLDSTTSRRRGESPMPRNVISAADLAYARPAATPGPLVLVGDSLAPAVRARWGERKFPIVAADWKVKSSESVIMLGVSAVRGVGPFARVSIDQSHLTARVHGRGQSWASSTTLYLMRRGGDWVIVSKGGWIT